MKGLFSLAAAAAVLASPALAQEPTTVVTAPNEAEQGADPVLMLTEAAAMVERGQINEARAVYERVEKMAIDYKVETTTGSWLYPAEAARRNLLALDRRAVQLASNR